MVIGDDRTEAIGSRIQVRRCERGCNIRRVLVWLLPVLLSQTAGANPAPTPCSVAALRAHGESSGVSPARPAAPEIHFELVARYPHDRAAFTQGLVFYRGALYESTGLYGHSSVRELDLGSGRIVQSVSLPETLFGEGLTVLNNRLLQLTWQSGTGLIYALDGLRETGRFSYSGEGWGSTGWDARLVISDGSSRLRLFDPTDYRLVATLPVTEHGRAVAGLNELETVGDLILANIYPTDCIAQIDPRTGYVVGWINLAELLPWSERPDGTAVANGIAYDPESGHLFVTGKLWPYLYRLKLRDAPVASGNRISSFGQERRPGTTLSSGEHP